MKTSCRWLIPYGVSDFYSLRRGREYYIDKTHYLPLLEQAGKYIFFIRPRRFGKSLLQSMMECYYDQALEAQFDELFHDTWIQANPTEEKHRYLVLRFDFSMVNPASKELQASFEEHVLTRLSIFCKQYAQWLPQDVREAVMNRPNAVARLQRLFAEISSLGLSLYLFIDEYDNFSNNLLVAEGRQKYQELTHSSGFFRNFFAELKGATAQRGSGLARLFITGVSPITLDDVTSGFNIVSNISLDPEFNALLGFTEAELTQMFADFGQDYVAHCKVMHQWYNGYHFHEERNEPVTNSDMALYYLRYLYLHGVPSKQLIDQNVRIDYGKLRHLIQIDKTLNGNFSRLKAIIEQGEYVGDVATSFPVEALLQQENFVSLLYYFGLLSFAGERQGRPLLRVPNQTIWQLIYGYLREAYQEVEVFKPSLWTLGDLLNRMAYCGEWAAFFDYLSEQIQEQAGVRDYLQGEKMIQGFLLAYLNLSPYFICHSEREWGGGFVDLFLAPFFFQYTDMKHGYLIELKYLKRGEDNPLRRQTVIAEAEAQLRRYASDERVKQGLGAACLHSLVLIFHGWELVYRTELDVS